MSGKVYLVGAGPGDFNLLTIGAVKCLKAADVVVYDHLADARILSFAPPTAELIYVGKEANRHTMRQEEISRLICDKALANKTVVRLKGGDPFVFGRGGEEALLLKEKGVPFEIIPGVTSAIAVPAYAGIPVTHRRVATSFAVVTGHEDPTKGDSQMSWDKLATATDTLVFLMGVENLPKICAKLIENGRDPKTPAAVIRWGTKPEQKTLVTTVENAAADVAKNKLKPPAIFIVGDVVKLRENIAWFDDLDYRPLFGKTVLVTRSRAQASALSEKLAALGAKAIELPAIELTDPSDSYQAIDAAIEKIENFAWLIFTSTNGVERFFQRLDKAGKDARCLSKAKICAIGSATAAKLKNYGLKADLVPQQYKAEGIIEAIGNLADLKQGTEFLIPRAEAAREILPEKLREMGYRVTVAPLYQTVTAKSDAAPVIDALKNGEIDCVTFTSTSTVENFINLTGDANLLKMTKIAAIGPITAAAVKKHGLSVAAEAAQYTIDELVKTVVDLLYKMQKIN